MDGEKQIRFTPVDRWFIPVFIRASSIPTGAKWMLFSHPQYGSACELALNQSRLGPPNHDVKPRGSPHLVTYNGDSWKHWVELQKIGIDAEL